MKNLSKIAVHFAFFIFGMIFTLTVTPTVTIVKEFLFGFEIQSMASFPYYHQAKLYTRPGLGDQTLTLEVDKKNVWVSGDAAPGDLQEKLIWDATGHLLTLELCGKPVIIYDALNREIKYRRF